MSDLISIYATYSVAGNCGGRSIAQTVVNPIYYSGNETVKSLAMTLRQAIKPMASPRKGEKLLIIDTDTVTTLRDDEKARKFLKGRHCVYAGNKLIVIPPKDSPFTYPSADDLEDLSHFRTPKQIIRDELYSVSMCGLPEVEAFTKVTVEDLAGYLNTISYKVKNRVITYSGAYATRRPHCDIKNACGMFAVALLARVQEQHGVKPKDQWYQVGTSDWHVAFPCPLWNNPLYLNTLPHSGDSFAMLLFHGHKPPPIRIGGFTRVSRYIRRKS